MAEENANTMNLDLNLGPVDNSSDGSYTNVDINSENWSDGPIHRVRVRQRNHRWRSLWRRLPIPAETLGAQTGEGSVASEARPNEVPKICEKTTGSVEDEDVGKKKDGGNGGEGSFFDCNICLDLAKDPVVTCCGHLFCWACLYRWLHHFSDARECPVCKGEVSSKNVTPIYGRGSVGQEPDLDSSLKIPLRPDARRIESWRQTLQRTATAFTIPMEEMIRRLGSAFDLNRELAQMHSRNDTPERTNARLLTSRGMRRERAPILPPDDVIDLTLTESSPQNNYDRDGRRFSSLLLRRSSSHRASSLTSAMNSAESLAALESYFHGHPVERLPPPVDDRDSVSSIAAVIHSESQTVDNAVEIDSTVALSTSSSRRRSDASRVSDVDSGDSRVPRRRRLN